MVGSDRVRRAILYFIPCRIMYVFQYTRTIFRARTIFARGNRPEELGQERSSTVCCSFTLLYLCRTTPHSDRRTDWHFRPNSISYDYFTSPRLDHHLCHNLKKDILVSLESLHNHRTHKCKHPMTAGSGFENRNYKCSWRAADEPTHSLVYLTIFNLSQHSYEYVGHRSTRSSMLK